MDAKIGTCWRCGNQQRVACTRCCMAVYCGEGCLYDDKFRHKGECDNAAKIRQCGNCKRDIVVVKQCSACLQQWYCGDKCQTEAWSTHQKKCTAVQDDILKIAQMMKVASWRMNIMKLQGETLNIHYWGNTPAVDLLNLKQNEWEGDARPDKFSLLLCGAGDLRNVIKTGASLPSEYNGHVMFHINDISQHIQARNVLFLYLLFTCDDVISMSEMLVQIWYSLCLTELCWKVLERNLKELIRSDASTILKNTSGKCKISVNHLDRIKLIWKLWLKVGQHGGPAFHIALQRKWLISKDAEAEMGWMNYVNRAPVHHRVSLQEWWEGAILLSCTDPRRSKALVQNVTLLRINVSRVPPFNLYCRGIPPALKDESMMYGLPTDALPFTCWDYIDASAYCNVPSVITMYSNYISHNIEQFGTNLKNGLMSFNVSLDSCFNLTKRLVLVKFDRISTSNIADYYGIPVVLDFAKGLLNTANPNAVIITELMNWDAFDNHVNAESYPCSFKALSDVAQDTGMPSHNFAFHICLKTWECYRNIVSVFINCLRADFLIHKFKDTKDKTTERAKIPDYHTDVAQYKGLKLRDFTQQLNRVVPHQWRTNRRTVTQLSGYERNLEWVVSQDTQECQVS
ncbi:LOW QUALITY PROTEIN: uncharacterized protein LOC144361773 [Saccoglossus kowalevskii]